MAKTDHTDRPRLGFIGLGTMGAPMAQHLLNAGYPVATVVHRTSPRADLVAAGLTVADSVAELARDVDTVLLMLPDTPDVEDVLFGERGLAGSLQPGATVIDLSSISPTATRDFAARLTAVGVRYVDAPVSGGEVGAIAGTLTIFVGADETDFDRVKPMLLAMGSKATHIGPVGSGQICKVANQMIVALTLQAVAEALVFASRGGVDPAIVRSALDGGLATSRILDSHGLKMIERTFDPGFRINLHAKDLRLAVEAAQQNGASVPGTALAHQLFQSAALNGLGDADHSAIVQMLEKLSSHELTESHPGKDSR